jgi:hypothetical protein
MGNHFAGEVIVLSNLSSGPMRLAGEGNISCRRELPSLVETAPAGGWGSAVWRHTNPDSLAPIHDDILGRDRLAAIWAVWQVSRPCQEDRVNKPLAFFLADGGRTPRLGWGGDLFVVIRVRSRAGLAIADRANAQGENGA